VKRKQILSQIGEVKFIQTIKKLLSSHDPDVLCGIGDDAAVLNLSGKKILFTVDALLEKVHFTWRTTTPYFLGRKSLAVNLSDIAAMGGKPRWAVVSLALPPRTKLETVREFYRGLRDCSRDFGVEIVGGDTDHSPDGWKITVALIGEAKNVVYRKGAKVGDWVWVTGEIGRVAARQNPTPRVREGQALGICSCASSMIDVSDGLLLDLEHLCEASGVGAKIYANQIPLKNTSLELALTGGEDYELLFTAPLQNKNKIQKLFKRLGTPVTPIGEIVSKREKIRVLDRKGKIIEMRRKGYTHF
jgi:thiamine-monophosphate kinase